LTVTALPTLTPQQRSDWMRDDGMSLLLMPFFSYALRGLSSPERRVELPGGLSSRSGPIRGACGPVPSHGAAAPRTSGRRHSHVRPCIRIGLFAPHFRTLAVHTSQALSEQTAYGSASGSPGRHYRVFSQPLRRQKHCSLY